MDKFVPVHKMSTLPNTDWEIFHDGKDLYFIHANAKGRTSTIRYEFSSIEKNSQSTAL
jgi:hypothetical protein